MLTKKIMLMGAVGTALGCFLCGQADAALVDLQNDATATHSQGGFEVDKAVDELIDSSGWAVDRGGVTFGETAVFKPTSPVGTAAGTALNFDLYQLFGGSHTLGKFRLAVTNDLTSEFGHGANSGGVVTADWTNLIPTSVTSSGGQTFTIDPVDGSVLVTGPNPATDTYEVTATTNKIGITGFRLEALPFVDASQANGPGRAPNGNFVLTEFTVDAEAVPEPAALSLLGLGGLLALRRRR